MATSLFQRKSCFRLLILEFVFAVDTNRWYRCNFTSFFCLCQKCEVRNYWKKTNKKKQKKTKKNKKNKKKIKNKTKQNKKKKQKNKKKKKTTTKNIDVYKLVTLVYFYGHSNDRRHSDSCCFDMRGLVNKRPRNYCPNKLIFRHVSAIDDAIE